MVSALPALLDCKGIMRETGLTRAAAEALMRNVATVHIEGLRKTYVRREDVLTYLAERSFDGGRVRVAG